MVEESLVVKFIGDDGSLKKSLSSLNKDLAVYKKALENAGNVTALKQATEGIKQTEAAMALLRKTAGNAARSTDAATSSLIDLSRVAQDAPYGFIGIANNLNPALESLGRLRAESGSTKAALSSMVAGLTGPAGVGLALGVASSLLVTFGDKLFAAGKDTEKLDRQMAAFNQTLEETKGRLKDIASALQFGNTMSGLNIEVLGLGDLTKLRSDRNGIVQAIEKQRTEVDRLGKEWAQASLAVDNAPKGISEKALEALKNHADNVHTLWQQAGEERTRLEEQERIITKQIQLQKIKDAREAAGKLKEINEKAAAEQKKRIEEYKKYQQELQSVRDFLSGFKNPDIDLARDAPQAKKTFAPVDNFLAGQKALYEKLFAPENLGDIAGGKAKGEILDQYRALFKSIGKELPKTLQMGEDGKGGLIIPIEFIRINDVLREELKEVWGSMSKESLTLAENINSMVTPAFQNLFSAIVAGESPLKAFFSSIGQSVQQLISQLIAAALQAAILSALPGGGTFGAAFKNILGGIPHMAEGGIVTRPTLALIGEGKSAEAVIPLDKWHTMLKEDSEKGFVVSHTIKGTDLQLLIARTQKYTRRVS